MRGPRLDDSREEGGEEVNFVSSWLLFGRGCTLGNDSCVSKRGSVDGKCLLGTGLITNV